MIKNVNKVTDFELDQLKESVNIGVSHASTALSQLIKKKVNISVPEAHIARTKDSLDFIGDKDKIATSVIVKILGQANGSMVFVFPGNNGLRLARMVVNSKDDNVLLTQEDRSALSEVGNILSGACLTALSKFLNISILHSVSEIVTDLLGTIVKYLMIKVVKSDYIALIFKVNMTIDREKIETQMFFLMDQDFTQRVLQLTQKSFVK